MIIDAQVHCYERDHPGRPWAAHLHGPPEVTGDDMVAAMDAVGVDGAILVSPWTLYRFDPSYVQAVQAAHAASDRLMRQLITIADTTAAIEQRIKEAETSAQKRDQDNFARRSAVLIESLNSISRTINRSQ